MAKINLKKSAYEEALEKYRAEQEQKEQQKTAGTKVAVADSEYDKAIKNYFSAPAEDSIGSRMRQNMGITSPTSLISTSTKPSTFKAYDRFVQNRLLMLGAKNQRKTSTSTDVDDEKPSWYHDRSEKGTAPFTLSLPGTARQQGKTENTGNTGNTQTTGSFLKNTPQNGSMLTKLGINTNDLEEAKQYAEQLRADQNKTDGTQNVKGTQTVKAAETEKGTENAKETENTENTGNGMSFLDRNKVRSVMPGGQAYNLKKTLSGEGIKFAQDKNADGTYEHVSSEDIRNRSAWVKDARALGLLDESDDYHYFSDKKLQQRMGELEEEIQDQEQKEQTYNWRADTNTRRQLQGYYGEALNDVDGIFYGEGLQIRGGKPKGYDENYDVIGIEADDAVYSAVTGQQRGTFKADYLYGTDEEREEVKREVDAIWDVLESSGSADEAFEKIRGYNLDEVSTGTSGLGEKRQELAGMQEEARRRNQIKTLEENKPSYGDGEYHEDLNRTQVAYHYEYGARLTGGDSVDQAYYRANHRFLEGNTNAFGEYEGDSSLFYQELGPDADPVYFMTDEQVDVFNRYYNAGDKESAQAYLDGLHYGLLANRAEWLKDYDTERASSNSLMGYATTLDTFLKNPIAGAKGTVGAVAAILGNEDAANPNSQWYDETRSVRDIRAERGTKWGEGLQDLYAWATGKKDNQFMKSAGNFLYGVFTSMGDMAVSTGIGLAFGGSEKATEGIVQLIMSSEASSMSMVENLEAGKSPVESGIMAIASGAIEAVTEKYSIEALLSEPKTLGKYLLKNTFTEGSEEVASDLLNTVADSAASLIWNHRTDIQKDYDRRLQELKSQGVGDEEAKHQAAKDTLLGYLQGLGTDFLAGAMSGFNMAAGKVAVKAIENAKKKRWKKALIRLMTNAAQTAKKNSQVAELSVSAAGARVADTELKQAAGIHGESRGTAVYEVSDENGNREIRSGMIAGRENGEYIIQDAEGNETRVAQEEAKATDEVTAATLNYAETSGLDDQTATALLKTVQDEHITEDNIEKVLKGSTDMIVRGYLKEELPANLEMDPYAAEKLYREGAELARIDEENRKSAAEEEASVLNPGEGKVEYRNIDRESLTETQQEQMDTAAKIAEHVGFNVIFENDAENKNRFGEYDPTTGSVIINLAGENSEGMSHHVMVTMSHELTHMLEKNSPEAYSALRQFVFQEMRKNGADLTARLQQKMENYNHQITQMREKGQDVKDINLAGAMAELVADACDQVLGNENMIQQMAEEQPSLYQKVKNFVKDFIAKVKAATVGMRQSGSIDSRFVTDLDGLAKKWGIALQEVQGKTNETSNLQQETEQNARFSFKNTINEDYADQFKRLNTPNLRDWVRSDSIVFAKETPEIYKLAGFDTKIPLTMQPSNMRKAIREKASSTHSAHGIAISSFENADTALAEPYFVLVQPSRNSAIAFTDITKDGRPVSIPIVKDVQYDTETSNDAISAFPVENAAEYISKILEKDRAAYIITNENNVPKVLGRANSISAAQSLVERYYGNLPQNESAVNDEFENRNKNQTQMSLAEMDDRYMQAVETGDEESMRELVDAAAEKAGYTLKVYHGTPAGGFTQFRDWSYFTENKAYADRYQNPGASSIRSSREEGTRQTYELLMNPGRAFDTRKPKEAKIYNQARMEYGMGALTETDTGLPDWTNGGDLIDYIEENDLPYDTIVLDEGADGGYGEKVVKRGVSYVTRSTQVKSADPVTYNDNGDVIPLSERFNTEKQDIRFSLDEGAPDANEWIMGLDPNDLTGDAVSGFNNAMNRKLIENYQKNVREIQGINQTMREMREKAEAARQEAHQIRERMTEEKGAEKDRLRKKAQAKDEEARKYRINLQTEEGKLKRAQRNLNQLNENGDLGKIMRRAQMTIDTFLRGKTEAEVEDSVRKMQKEAKSLRKAAADAAESLEKLGNREDVALAQRTLDQQKLKKAAEHLKENFGGNAKLQEIQDQLGNMVLKTMCGDYAAGTASLEQDLKSLIGYMAEKDWAALRFEVNKGQKWYSTSDLGEGWNEWAMNEALDAYGMAITAAEKSGAGEGSGADSMTAYLHQVAEMTRQSAKGMRRMENLGRLMEEKGEKVAAAAGEMRKQLREAIKYYDMVNEKNRTAARAEEIEGVIRTLESESAKRLLQEQLKWTRRIERDRDTRRLSQENMALRKKINTAFTRTAKLILNETDLKNIPEYMKPVARAAVRMILDNDVDGGHKITGMDWQTMQRYKKVMDAIDQRDGTDINGSLQEIVDILGGEDDDIAVEIEEALQKIQDGISYYNSERGRHTVVLEGDKAALTMIQEGMSTIYDVSTRAGQVFINGKFVSTGYAAGEVESEARKRETYREYQGTLGKAIRGIQNAVTLGNMTPEYFFKNLKNNGISWLYSDFKKAEDRYGKILLQVKGKLESIYEKYGYSSWDTETKHAIVLKSGETVNLTLEQMMSLLATWSREKTLGPEWSAHLRKGGFVYEEESDRKVYGREAQQQKPHKFEDADIDTIMNEMTKEQIDYVNEMVGILSKDMAEIGNEASLQMFGIKKYKETYYYPFQIWDGVKNKASNAGSAVNPTNNNRAAHQSFTKRRIAGASNAVKLGNFTETCLRHVNQMATYATVGQAVENMNRVLNYRMADFTTGDGKYTERSVESLLEQQYGKDATGYMRRFMQDINGGAVQQGVGFGMKLMSLFKKNAVGGSLSVALQQPLSYIRAATMIDTRHLTAAAIGGEAWKRVFSGKTWQNAYDEMMQYSGVAVIKDMGKFDMNFSSGAVDWLSPEGKKTRGQQIYQTAEDITNALPEKMDQMTWVRMWTACKYEQHQLHPDMDMQSKEFLNIVGERFNDVMRKTQVYDSVLVKSQLMRNQDWFSKSITAFRAEPTLSLNLMMDAMMNIKEKDGKKNLASVLTTFLLGAIGQAAVKGAMGAGRNPDEKKTLAENFAYRFGAAFISEANPLSLIPGYDNIVDALSGNDINDNAWGMIKTLGTTAQKIWNPPAGEALNATTGWRYVEDTIGQITQMFSGIPAKNLMRDSRAIYNLFLGEATGKYADRATSGNVLKYQTIDQVTNSDLLAMIQKMTGTTWWGTNATAYYTRIYEAEKAGRTEDAAALREYMTAGKGKTEKAVNSGVASLAKGDESRTAAETADYLLGSGYAEGTSWITSQFKEGNISEDELKKLYEEHFPDKDADKALWNYWRTEYTEGRIGEKEATEKYKKYNPEKTDQQARDYFWQEHLQDYKDGKITESQAMKLYKEYHPDKKDQDVRDYFWKDHWQDYKDGKITESQALKLYKEFHPDATEKDAAGTFWNYAKEQYISGDITRADAEKIYKKYYTGTGTDDVWWAMDKLDYQKETGTSPYGDYYRIHDAIEGNSSQAITGAVQQVLKHGKTKEGLLSSIKGKWAETYLAMKDGSREKVRLKDGIIKALKAAGYTEAEAEKKINSWKKK